MSQALGWEDDIYWACMVWRMFWEAMHLLRKESIPSSSIQSNSNSAVRANLMLKRITPTIEL